MGLLKIKKYLNLKDIGINDFLNNLEMSFDDILEVYDNCKYITKIKKPFNFIEIKNSDYKCLNYKILKDNNTDTWFLLCPKLIILTIDHDIYENTLKEMEVDLKRMAFIVYKIVNQYIMICISHFSDELNDKIMFSFKNNSDRIYILLSQLLGSYVILNDSYLNTCEIDETDNIEQIKLFKNIKMKYITIIGEKTNINQDLLDFSYLICSIKNNYKFLPKHYLIT